MKHTAAFLCLLATAADLPACPLIVRRKVVAPVVAVTPAVVATFVPVQVAAYSAAYQPPPVDVSAELKALREEVAALRSAGAVTPTTPPPSSGAPGPAGSAAPAPAATPDNGAARFAANCASCHDAATAKAKGGGLTLFEQGKPLALSCEVALKCTGAIADGSMPKGKELSAEDGPAILVWLAKQAKK